MTSNSALLALQALKQRDLTRVKICALVEALEPVLDQMTKMIRDLQSSAPPAWEGLAERASRMRGELADAIDRLQAIPTIEAPGPDATRLRRR